MSCRSLWFKLTHYKSHVIIKVIRFKPSAFLYFHKFIFTYGCITVSSTNYLNSHVLSIKLFYPNALGSKLSMLVNRFPCHRWHLVFLLSWTIFGLILMYCILYKIFCIQPLRVSVIVISVFGPTTRFEKVTQRFLAYNFHAFLRQTSSTIT